MDQLRYLLIKVPIWEQFKHDGHGLVDDSMGEQVWYVMLIMPLQLDDEMMEDDVVVLVDHVEENNKSFYLLKFTLCAIFFFSHYSVYLSDDDTGFSHMKIKLKKTDSSSFRKKTKTSKQELQS